jgi:hypothetical protein
MKQIFLFAWLVLQFQTSQTFAKGRLRKLPIQIQLKADAKSPISCSDGCDEKVVFSLKTIDGLQLEKRTSVKPLFQALRAHLGAVYAYRISTPGLGGGGESYAHPLLLKDLMNQLGCDQGHSDREVMNGSEILFRQEPHQLALMAGLIQNLFQDLFVETRSLGRYDRTPNGFPYYYPQFKPLHRYVGFSCFQQIDRDEDGVETGVVYSGLMIGDEVDFSPEADLPPVGLLANKSRLGFLLLFRKNAWD